MSLKLTVFPINELANLPTVFSDPTDGVRSITELSTDADNINLNCDIILSDTFAFCGVSIPLTDNVEQGLDMRKYSNMNIEMEFSSRPRIMFVMIIKAA